MIIPCGKRRIVGFRFGWKIEIQHQREKDDGTTEIVWKEDRPAWPATLEQACAMCAERELKDGGNSTLDELPARLERATHAVRKYLELARRAA